MSHPNVAAALANLDPGELELVQHAVTCPVCATELVAQPLGETALAELALLEAELTGISGRLQSFAASLKESGGSTAILVRARLQCLIADRMEPGVRDLASIAQTARGDDSSETARGNFDLGELR